MKKKINVILLLITITSASAFYLIVDENENNKDISNTVSPKISTIQKKRYISGVVIPAKEIAIKSQFSGILEKLYCQVGDKVRQGQKIAKIKLIPDPASVENMERNVKLALIRFKDERETYDRNKKLYDERAISLVEFNRYKKDFLLTQEELQSAKNQLILLKEGYKKNIKEVSNLVYSTTDGTVLELPLKEGASVIERNNFNEGSTVAGVADLTSLMFTGSVNETDISYLKLGDEIRLSIPSIQQDNIKARLERIAPKGVQHNNVIYFDVVASIIYIENMAFLRTGFSAIAELVLETRKDVVTIEEKNIEFTKDSIFVHVVEKGITKKRAIETGLSDGLNIEIKKGLSVYDKIKALDI